MATDSQAARFDVRLPRETDALLEIAADLEGRTLTDFVVSAATDAVCRTIEEVEMMRVSVEDQRAVAASILDAPHPVGALRRAVERRKKLLGY